MKDWLKFRNFMTLVFTLAAIYLAMMETSNWGWFLFMAFLTML